MDFRDPVSIPQPKTDDEFERICLLIARDRYGPEFYRYARSGQAQYGIDIYSVYYHGRFLQCKLHKKAISDAKLIDELKKDLLQAKQKFRDMKQFIFAVSLVTRPTVQDFCRELSDDEVQVIPWFWNQLQEDISRSKWLLRYCLNYETGAQWISDDFLEEEEKRGKEEGCQPLQFYSSNLNAQWYGILQNWDAPRQHYEDIKEAIANSFVHTYSDIPVAAVVRGEGGSGKSVLLRRLSIDLRSEYTIYWIADNASDFLQNEWLYDIDNHPTEKYLLVLEDWYRNFTSTGDRSTANRLLQKIKQKPNVRLLIGDRPAQFTYYSKTDDIIFDLKSDENAALVSFIIDIVPDWKDKFLDEENAQLFKAGLFQVLFIYQYLDTSKSLQKGGNYFLEIVQSDYKRLANSEYPFYKGLAQSLYVFSHLYADFGLYISVEALIVLAEYYSDSQRPHAIQYDILTIADDPIMSRYIDVVANKSISDTGSYWLQFFHDTLADQGWKYASVDTHNVFGNSASIVQLIDALKTEKTAYDLAVLLFFVLKAKPELLTKGQALSCCNYLISIGCESHFYVLALFTEGLIKMSVRERNDYIQRLIGLGKLKDPFWSKTVIWMKRRLSDKDHKETLLKLIEAGTRCNSVFTGYFNSLNDDELKQTSDELFTVERLKKNRFASSLSVIFKRLRHNEKIRSISCKYLQSPEPEKVSENFTTCLNILKDEEVAKIAARNYLQSPEPEKVFENFTTCLNILKDEEVAKDIAARILTSPVDEQDHRFIYRALFIATEAEELDILADDMVCRILEARPRHFNKAEQRQFYLYLQMMKVPLFRIKPWQSEVDRLLQNKSKIHRNLFYSLTLSHVEKPVPIAEACLFYVRNWRSEFKRPKKYWGYFIRSLAHPIIVERSNIKEEISQLCSQMLRTHSCPSDLKGWLRSITEEKKFPLWKSAKDEEL